jgi:predicted flap endonuclease-1-like 5' DNA nuclease
VARIDEIAGIDPKDATKLRKAGIRTTESLLRRASGKGSREQLAESIGLDADQILKWAQRADLMRVKGVGSEYGLLLEACGVTTIRDLRRRNATALTVKLSDHNGRKAMVRRLPTEVMVVSWIEAAKSVEPLVKP